MDSFPTHSRKFLSASIACLALGTLLLFIFTMFFLSEKEILKSEFYNVLIPVAMIFFILGMIVSVAVIEGKK